MLMNNNESRKNYTEGAAYALFEIKICIGRMYRVSGPWLLLSNTFVGSSERKALVTIIALNDVKCHCFY